MTLNIPHKDRPCVVIVGGGCAGLRLAIALAGTEYQVVLIDRNNHHQLSPLLPAVVSGRLDVDEASLSIRELLRPFGSDIQFRMAEVQRVRPAEKRIETSAGILGYDFLVIATGTKPRCIPMQKSANLIPAGRLNDTLAIRYRIVRNFEQALLTRNRAERQSYLSFVVVGGDETGAALAATLARTVHRLTKEEYPDSFGEDVCVYLIESGPRLVRQFSETGSERLYRELANLGVKIMCRTTAVACKGCRLIFQDGSYLSSRCIIWSADRRGEIPEGFEGNAITESGRLTVDPFLRVAGYDRIFAIGEVAQIRTPETDAPRRTAPHEGIGQARTLAATLRARLKHDAPVSYRIRTQPIVVPLGDAEAITEQKSHTVCGFAAWRSWLADTLRIAPPGKRLRTLRLALKSALGSPKYTRPIPREEFCSDRPKHAANAVSGARIKKSRRKTAETQPILCTFVHRTYPKHVQ